MFNPCPHLIAVGLAFCLCGGAFGQVGSSRAATDLRRAISSLESNDAASAEQVLGALRLKDPDYYHRELGSAALWHGRAIMAQRGAPAALGAWSSGWRSLVKSGVTDAALGLELIWTAFENGQSAYYDQAASIYLGLIDGMPRADAKVGWRLRTRLLEPFLLIAPPEIRSSLASRAEEGKDEPVTQDDVLRIANWWRSLDPLPATQSNERLIEHLRRLVYASHAYPGADGELLDDRGKLYVRLGEPWRRHAVRPPRSGFLRSRRQTGSGLRVELTNKAYTLPGNEFWVYNDVDPAAQYLFIANPDGSFSLGSTYDLLPLELRTQRHSLDQLDVMAHILGELALLHPDSFEHAFTRVSTFLSDLELNAFADYATNMSSVSVGDSARMGGLRVPMEQSVASFARMAVTRNRAEERRAARIRDARVPDFYFDDFPDVEKVAVDARWARFLSPAGETLLNVYWTTPNGLAGLADLEPVAGEASTPPQVDFTIVRYDEAYQSNVRNVIRTTRDQASSRAIGTQVFQSTIPNLKRNESFGFQWDVFIPM
ncbi:MAG: GWxTD domain-containing protein, partial [Rhodothermales bacterium]|nr:GWxTD domain-containing protein [Rhodothermales bacterium]